MSVTVMSFSGVYKEQEFYQSKRIDKRVEAEQVEETNCYCTEEAEEKIKKTTYIKNYHVAVYCIIYLCNLSRSPV